MWKCYDGRHVSIVLHGISCCPATEDAVTDSDSDNLSSRIENDRALQRRFYIATYTRSPIRTLHTYLSSQAAILLNHDGSERKQGFIYIILLFV